MRLPIRSHALLLPALLALTGCPTEEGSPDSDAGHAAADAGNVAADAGAASDAGEVVDAGPEEPRIVRIKVLPEGILLTEPGDSKEFTVVAYDENDQMIEGLPFEAIVDDPDVSLEGTTVTAVADVGSATIIVRSEGFSRALVVVIAQPAENAVMVPDSAVQNIEALDEGPVRIGSRYQLVIEGVALELGSIVLGTQTAPLNGRITEIEGNLFTLEVVRPEEAFPRYQIDEVWNLSDLEPKLDPETADQFVLSRLEDGTLQVRPKDQPLANWDQPLGFDLLYERAVCRSELAPGQSINLGSAGLNFKDADMALDASLSSRGLPLPNKILAVGRLELEPAFTFSWDVGFSGTVTCKQALIEWEAPMVPQFAWASLGARAGVGLKVSGSVVGLDASITAKSKYVLEPVIGFDCTSGDCRFLAEMETTKTPSIEVNEFNPAEDMRAQAELAIFGYFSPTIGVDISWDLPLGGSLEILEAKMEVAEIRAGLSEQWNVAPVFVQAENKRYASEEVLSVFASIGLPWLDWLCARDGSCSFWGVINFPSIQMPEWRWPIARSPKGSVTSTAFEIVADELIEGEPVPVIVRLDPQTVRWGRSDNDPYNVEEVVIYEYDSDNLTTIERARIVAQDDQSVFEWQWTPTAEEVENPPEFTAFVDPIYPPYFEMEIAANTRRRWTDNCLPDYSAFLGLSPTSPWTIVGKGGSINDRGDVSFIGDNGSGETVVIAHENGSFTTPSFQGGGRRFRGGGPINSSGQVAATDSQGGVYYVRTWQAGQQNLVVGASNLGSFDSVLYWMDINDTGQLAYSALHNNSQAVTLHLFGGTVGPLTYPSRGTFIRPQLSNTGRVIFRNGDNELIVTQGLRVSVPHRGPVSYVPGISADGNHIAWMTTGEIETVHFGHEVNDAYEGIELVSSDGAFSDLDERSRQGVAHIPGVCDGGASVVVFVGTREGVQGVHLATINYAEGVARLAGIQTLLESGDAVNGQMVAELSLFDPISPNGNIVVKSGTDTLIVLKPTWP